MVRDVPRTGGERALRGDAWRARKKSGWGVSWTASELSISTSTSEVGDCSRGPVRMAQNGGTRGGTFHGEIDRCRESQAWNARTLTEMTKDMIAQKRKHARARSLAKVG